jgi:hypothetical protein
MDHEDSAPSQNVVGVCPRRHVDADGRSALDALHRHAGQPEQNRRAVLLRHRLIGIRGSPA